MLRTVIITTSKTRTLSTERVVISPTMKQPEGADGIQGTTTGMAHHLRSVPAQGLVNIPYKGQSVESWALWAIVSIVTLDMT